MTVTVKNLCLTSFGFVLLHFPVIDLMSSDNTFTFKLRTYFEIGSKYSVSFIL